MSAPDPIRSIVVVGGGTAGWMSAAALVRSLGTSVSITLVESEDIGTVGVGEATIPPIKLFNAMLGLNEAEFMRETRASHKLGIEFRDWGALNERYFHPFGTYGLKAELGHFLPYWLKLHNSGEPLDIADYSLCAVAARRNRMTGQSDDATSVLSHFGSAYHFDAILYARYLRRYCERLGVKRIEDRITATELDSDTGFVTFIKLSTGETHAADLFIDCSGFKGVLIEEALHTGYDDWTHWLPVNRAVAAPCQRTSDFTPYTIAHARSAGWTWRIPLQHRVGNGYVFSDAFTDETAATDLLLANLESAPLADPRVLRFTTGRRKKAWNKNVVAVGLSSGFLEPLESTSIHLIQASLNKLLQHFPDRSFSPVNTEVYNDRIARDVERIRDFLIVHYHETRRNDSELWNHVRTMAIPDSLRQKLEIFRERGQFINAPDEMFSDTSWLAVMLGQGVMPQSWDPLADGVDLAALRSGFSQMKATLAGIAESMPSHETYLREQGGAVLETA